MILSALSYFFFFSWGQPEHLIAIIIIIILLTPVRIALLLPMNYRIVQNHKNLWKHKKWIEKAFFSFVQDIIFYDYNLKNLCDTLYFILYFISVNVFQQECHVVNFFSTFTSYRSIPLPMPMCYEITQSYKNFCKHNKWIEKAFFLLRKMLLFMIII